jgi:hypothetical protein
VKHPAAELQGIRFFKNLSSPFVKDLAKALLAKASPSASATVFLRGWGKGSGPLNAASRNQNIRQNKNYWRPLPTNRNPIL